MTLREAAEYSGMLAADLVNWGPTSEKPETPGRWDVL
jgi:hypothetical protein